MSNEQVPVPCPVGEFDAVNCVYEKDGVFVHDPLDDGGENHLPGRLQIYEKNDQAFVRWLPLKSVDYPTDDDQGWAVIGQTPAPGEIDETLKEKVLHFPLAQVKSVQCVVRELSWQHLIITLKPGNQLPALYFQTAILRDFWQCLNRYLGMVKSKNADNVFEVIGGTDSLSQSLRGLNFHPDDTAGIVSGFFSGGVENMFLGGFSRVTQFLRTQLGNPREHTDVRVVAAEEEALVEGQPSGDEGTTPVADNPSAESVHSASAPASSTEPNQSDHSNDELMNSVPVEMLRRVGSVSISGNVPQAEPAVESSVVEERPASLTFVSNPPSILAASSNTTTEEATGNVQTKPADEAPPSLTSRDENTPEETARAPTDSPASIGNAGNQPSEPNPALQSFYFSMNALPGASLINLDGFINRQGPISWAEWSSMLDQDGRLIDAVRFRRRLFKGGLEPSLRPLVWKFLLGYYSLDSTRAERERVVPAKRQEYEEMKKQWTTMKPYQKKRFCRLVEQQEIINKDVLRTDRDHPKFKDEDGPYLTRLQDILNTHVMYNFDLGYVQGMSDLLAPLLLVMEGDESDAFWCFAGLMELLEENFTENLVGMRHQLDRLYSLVKVLDPHLTEYLDKVTKNPSHPGERLYVCFRWLLILFKREFELEDVMRLWEILWSQHMSRHFHLFFAAAILTQQRRDLITGEVTVSYMLKHINGLAGNLDLDLILGEAERLCRELISMPDLPPDLQDLRPQLGWVAPVPPSL